MRSNWSDRRCKAVGYTSIAPSYDASAILVLTHVDQHNQSAADETAQLALTSGRLTGGCSVHLIGQSIFRGKIGAATLEHSQQKKRAESE